MAGPFIGEKMANEQGYYTMAGTTIKRRERGRALKKVKYNKKGKERMVRDTVLQLEKERTRRATEDTNNIR